MYIVALSPNESTVGATFRNFPACNRYELSLDFPELILKTLLTRIIIIKMSVREFFIAMLQEKRSSAGGRQRSISTSFAQSIGCRE